MDAMWSGDDGLGTECLGRRQVHSEEALESVRLKNSRAGHLSRVTTLCGETENLLSDAKNVDGVTNKLQEINEAFSRFEKAHYDYIATLSGDLEEWESEARYFQEHYRRKMNFVSRIEQWIHHARSTVEVREVSEPNPEDSVSTASSWQSSHLFIRQLRAKQALAHLKLYQLKQKQELLHQEEETKLKLEVLDAQCEIRKVDLQVKMLQDEEPPTQADLCNVFEDLNPFNEGVDARAGNVPKQEHFEPRKDQTIGPQDAPLRFNPKVREFASLPVASTAAFTGLGPTGSIMTGQIMDKMALTIKQGFALPKKELKTFKGDPLEYWNFIKSFEKSIVNNAASESEKLMYLLQYTSGVANDTIKCCLVMDSSLGYQRAKELLEERFGHPFTIASKYVTKLTKDPR